MTDMPQTAYKVLTADQMATLEQDGAFAGAPVDVADGYIHLSTADQMATLEQDGTFAGAPVDVADGYIHLSTAAQLTETVDKHFAGQADLHIAAVDLGSFGGSLKWEESRGGQLFPHLYGPLLLETVIAYGPLDRDDDGKVKLPVAG